MLKKISIILITLCLSACASSNNYTHACKCKADKIFERVINTALPLGFLPLTESSNFLLISQKQDGSLPAYSWHIFMNGDTLKAVCYETVTVQYLVGVAPKTYNTSIGPDAKKSLIPYWAIRREIETICNNKIIIDVK